MSNKGKGGGGEGVKLGNLEFQNVESEPGGVLGAERGWNDIPTFALVGKFLEAAKFCARRHHRNLK
jgi:hypothetical protein